jgi:hypothetical protein
MYFPIFFGSSLLHLIAAHPRLVAMFGIAGTVALAIAPHGPGRYAGTAGYIERLDARLIANGQQATEWRVDAERVADDMLAEGRRDEIESAVDHTLRQCGAGCTDLATPIVLGDPELLKRVLVLYQLDKMGEAARAVPATPRLAVNP